MGQVGNHGTSFGIAHDRANWYANDQISACCSILIAASARLAVLGTKDPGVAEIDQRVKVGVGFKVDAAATAAIATAGPPFGNIFFPPEGGTAIPPFASDHLDARFVKKLHPLPHSVATKRAAA